jgi:hypothetical protein
MSPVTFGPRLSGFIFTVTTGHAPNTQSPRGAVSRVSVDTKDKPSTSMPLAQLQNGVAGLVHGNFDQAIQCFRESLVLAGQQEASLSLSLSLSLPGGGRDDSNTASLPEEGFTSSLETMSSHNLFSLYDRAFVPHAQASAAVLSIICISNIGFAHHMRVTGHDMCPQIGPPLEESAALFSTGRPRHCRSYCPARSRRSLHFARAGDSQQHWTH